MGREGAYIAPIPGKRCLAVYKTRGTAQARANKLKKQGYSAKVDETMGTYSVWVSSKYFKDHPKAKGYYD